MNLNTLQNHLWSAAIVAASFGVTLLVLASVLDEQNRMIDRACLNDIQTQCNGALNCDAICHVSMGAPPQFIPSIPNKLVIGILGAIAIAFHLVSPLQAAPKKRKKNAK